MYQVVMALAVAVVASTAQAITIYVDDDACPAPGSGTKDDPYCSIQTAIDNALDTDEIVVAPGTYFEAIDFLGKAITLRSSDGPEGTTIEGDGAGSVVTCWEGEGPDTVLRGFTITGGNEELGGGMFIDGASPTLMDCTFTANEASLGGGMMVISGDPALIRCTFSGNLATDSGGGVRTWNASMTLIDCTFTGNRAWLGGGVFTHLGSPQLVNCTFRRNLAEDCGGGMHNVENDPTVTNCTFWENSAPEGGGGMFNNNSIPTVVNCVLWGDWPDEIAEEGGADTSVLYSDIQGGWAGPGNIDADPLCVDPVYGDFRLGAGSPCIDAGDNAAVPDAVQRDLDGNPRFVNATTSVHPTADPVVDMGAYEYQAGSGVRALLDLIYGSDAAVVAQELGLVP
jgi:hypothetical protein